MHKIGFIGAGNMGGALIIAACRSIGADQVLITDYDLAKAEALAQETGCHVAASNDGVVQDAEFVVLAVKPNVIPSVAAGISPALSQCVQAGMRRVVVTIAAGVPIATIQGCLEAAVPVVRIMPNTPVEVGQGMILLTCSQPAAGEDVDAILTEFQGLLSAAGDFERIPESAFDYTTSISGCTPAYAYMFIDALADGAVQVGVPRAQAIRLAAKTVLGSAAMVLSTGKHPDLLKDNVCSPGGSTIVGVNELEKHGFRYAVAQSIIRSTEKNFSLGK